MDKIEVYKRLDRDTIIDRLRQSTAKITEFLTEKKIEKEIITSATIGIYFLFSISDNHSDSEEYQFFIRAFSVAISSEDYRSLARQCGTKENIRRCAATADYITKAYPELKEDVEQIALCAMASNGKISENEERFFKLVFGE